MKLFRFFKLVSVWWIAFVFSACCVESFDDVNSGKQMVTIVNWNVQTFFDGERDGCEYQEFLKSGNWNREKYEERVKRLCDAIVELDADIYVFEEIENEGIIYDISNQLSGEKWGVEKGLNYSCFSKPEGTAIGCAVISKYELQDLTTHALDIRCMNEKQPSMRYLMKINADVNGEQLQIYVNHWKSKSGGEEESEIWRDWQESLLSGVLLDSNVRDGLTGSVLCGDFNRSVEDFIHEKNRILLRCAGFGEKKDFSVVSCWLDENGNFDKKSGSYYYQDFWERIDNIFTSGNIKSLSFSPCNTGPWAGADQTPYSFSLYNGRGYSDHLPVKAVICMERN